MPLGNRSIAKADNLPILAVRLKGRLTSLNQSHSGLSPALPQPMQGQTEPAKTTADNDYLLSDHELILWHQHRNASLQFQWDFCEG